MRDSLKIENVFIPGSNEPFSKEEKSRIEAKLQEWDASDYAGFRKILEKGSDCYPAFETIKKLANDRKTGGTGKPIKHFVLLGTGGSSLGGETIIRALHARGKNPEFHFMDNNDPEWFHWLLRSLEPEETLFYVVSKSGKTPETNSQFLASLAWAQKKLVGDSWKKHFVLCTDPEKGDLRELAKRFDLACLDVPPSVGGRFSVLTAVGLFPSAFAGLTIEAFLSGARGIITEWAELPFEKHPVHLVARALVRDLKKRPVTIFMPYSSQLNAFSRWFCQLWAESLGKEGKGPTPYPASGTTDQHSQMQLYMQGPSDKSIVLLRVMKLEHALPLSVPEQIEDLPSFRELKNRSMQDLFDAEFCATRDALTKQEVPNLTIELECLDEYSIGSLFYFWEWVTAVAGAYLKINPFDQPGVEAAKILTKRYLLEKRR